MVDVRPLLFINALAFMLLLTAGFAQVTSHKSHSGAEIPPLYTETSTIEQPTATNAEAYAQSATTGVAVEQTSQTPETTTDYVDEITPATAASDDAIFADTPPETTEAPDPIFADTTEHSSETMAARPEVEVTAPEEQAPAIAKTPEPAAAPAPKAPTLSKPIADKVEMEQVTFVAPAPIVAAKATTGQLTIRSNVSDDMVLVNGKPYGKTRLDLTLKPGNYDIEVAKSGYVSWKGSAQIVAGKESTLIARLEEYTSVEYRNGKWRGGIISGEGVFVDSDGTEYTGSFVNKLFHGKGSIRYPDGTKYSGDWFEGKMQGRGSLTLSNGDTYIGEFREDQFNGDGTLTKANGDIYSGFWVNGALNGQGSLTTKKGLLYVGSFSDNLFHGNGNLTYPDSRHYEGGFSNGKYHGKGIETFATGKQYSGQFMDGQYHGQGEIQNPNGSKINGTFKFGQPYGKAILTTPEGEVFTARTTEPGVCYRDKSYRATTCPPMEGW